MNKKPWVKLSHPLSVAYHRNASLMDCSVIEVMWKLIRIFRNTWMIIINCKAYCKVGLSFNFLIDDWLCPLECEVPPFRNCLKRWMTRWMDDWLKNIELMSPLNVRNISSNHFYPSTGHCDSSSSYMKDKADTFNAVTLIKWIRHLCHLLANFISDLCTFKVVAYSGRLGVH